MDVPIFQKNHKPLNILKEKELRQYVKLADELHLKPIF